MVKAKAIFPYFLTIVATMFILMLIDGYLQFDYRALNTEAKDELRMIYDSQSRYFEHNKELAVDFKTMGHVPNNERYAIYYNNTVIPSKRSESVSLPNFYRCYRDDKKWNAYAVGNLDADEELDIWMIDETGKILYLHDDYRSLLAVPGVNAPSIK